jgi:hypothetical protein
MTLQGSAGRMVGVDAGAVVAVMRIVLHQQVFR